MDNENHLSAGRSLALIGHVEAAGPCRPVHVSAEVVRSSTVTPRSAESQKNSPPPATAEDVLLSAEEAFAVGRAAWPTLTADAASFERYVAELGFKCDGSAARVADLYLVHACLQEIPGAIEAFEATYRQTIECAARCVEAPPSFVDEVKQRLREVLFVSKDGSQPRISQYSGHGPLAGWIATTTRRIAFRLARTDAARKFVGEEALASEFCKGGDPDLVFLKAQYKVAFDEAIVRALRKLPRRERLILRLNLVQGVSLDRIAKMHNVSQPTVSRWLQRARVQILKTIRDVIRDELHIQDHEFDSVLYLVRSQIDVSFSRLLGETNE
jgi:RNA polymerase sigma-70 factor (ECF subfamily)